MPPPVYRDTMTPDWLKPENASVFDSSVEKVIRMLAQASGATDPETSIFGLMAPMETGPAGGVMGALNRLIRAYHGSPHDFNKFSLSKVGTGEGAQAYGHGLYFADRPETARAYRDNLSKFGYASSMPDDMTTSVLLDNKVVSGREPSNRLSALQRAALAKHYAGGIQARAIQDVEESLRYLTPGTPAYQLDKETLDVLRTVDLTGRVQPFGGRMYEVDIRADPESLLDWDKPLSQQSQAVRTMAEQGPKKSLDFQRDFLRREPTGQALYTNLAGTQHQRAVDASSALKEAGIPGLKYLDQGSRAGGEGTRNYVIFDDQIIDILRKWGLLPPIAAGALSQQEQQP